MIMTHTQIQELGLSHEVTQALSEYNTTIHSALQAVQKLESIAITARLASMFWIQEQKTAQMIRMDYLVKA